MPVNRHEMNRRFVYTFLIIGLFVGLLLSWQFNSEVRFTGGFIGDEALARENLLKSFLDEQAYLQSRIVTLREDIDIAESDINMHSSQANLEILEKLKSNIGLSVVRGQGIEITLNDGLSAVRDGSEVASKELIQASDIRDIVNVLNASNSDGIAVNGQRIIASSPIASVGTTILVNSTYIAPPFTISAVGDPDIMLQRILNDGLLKPIYARSSKKQISIRVVIKDILEIPVYSGDFKTSYLNLIN